MTSAGPAVVPWPGFIAPGNRRRSRRIGGMLAGGRIWDVGDRVPAEGPSSGEDDPFSGPMFVITHRPLDPPVAEVRIVSGDIRDAVAAALPAQAPRTSSGGTDEARQCLEAGLVDEVLVSRCRYCSARA